MTRIPIEDENNVVDPASLAGDDGGGAAASAASGAAATAAGDDALKLREERDAYYDRWVRSKADAENMRKRMQTEFDQRSQYANQALIKSLLPVIDNFERALAQDVTKVDAASILRGMQIIHDEWLRVLKQQNVEEIAPEPGTPFDPSQHEALLQQDAPYKTPSVTQLLQKGYSLQGRTLRPAKVAVSRAS